MRRSSLFLLFFAAPAFAGVVPLKDNVLFAFERCKALSVDLKKGQLREAVVASFDLHCKRTETPLELRCEYFDPGGEKALRGETFTGGSELGAATLVAAGGTKLRFLIGKDFAAYESGPEQKVCVGIYLFEADARKRTGKP